MSSWTPTTRGLTLAAVIVGLDTSTKALAEARLRAPVEIIGGFRFELGHNSGVAFGAFADLPGWVVLAGLVLVLGCIGALGLRGGMRVPWVAAGLLGGGAAGNLVDRIGDGRVTDFIEVPYWPTFNLADIAITAAVAALLLARSGADRVSGNAAAADGPPRDWQGAADTSRDALVE